MFINKIMKKLLFIVLTIISITSSCKKDIEGCTDSSACNYDSEATIDNGSCLYPSDIFSLILGQLSELGELDCNGNCIDELSCNYLEEGPCEFPQDGYDCDDIFGCSDTLACNYSSDVTVADNSCEYPIEFYDCDEDCIVDSDEDGVCDELEILGCTDIEACNYNFDATEENGSCEYADEGGNCQYEIGGYANGGIIFYLDETGQHGLVAAVNDVEGRREWGCWGVNVNGTSQEFGMGLQNTLNIIATDCQVEFPGNETVNAAQAAYNHESGGYSDWYLPSVDELRELVKEIGPNSALGNLANLDLIYWYWTSSQSGENTAYQYDITFGSSGMAEWMGWKDYFQNVRPIRSF